MAWTDCTQTWPTNIISTGGIEVAKTMREIFSGTLISVALCLSLIVIPAAAVCHAVAKGDTLRRFIS